MWEEIVPIAVGIVTAVAIFFLLSRLLGYKSDTMWEVVLEVLVEIAAAVAIFSLVSQLLGC